MRAKKSLVVRFMMPMAKGLAMATVLAMVTQPGPRLLKVADGKRLGGGMEETMGWDWR
jgi:hypothetical protein